MSTQPVTTTPLPSGPEVAPVVLVAVWLGVRRIRRHHVD